MSCGWFLPARLNELAWGGVSYLFALLISPQANSVVWLVPACSAKQVSMGGCFHCYYQIAYFSKPTTICGWLSPAQLNELVRGDIFIVIIKLNPSLSQPQDASLAMRVGKGISFHFLHYYFYYKTPQTNHVMWLAFASSAR